MEFSSRILALTYLTLPHVTSLIYPTHAYKRNGMFDNKVCGDVVLSISDTTLLACSIECAQERTCKSLCFNTASRTCFGCSEKYTAPQQMSSELGYFYLQDVTKNYHMECEIDSDCNEDNNICEMTRKICVCTPGYSYDSSTMSCVTDCLEYGSTFETYPYYYIAGLNVRQIRDTTYQNCLQACKDEGTFTCRSFDWAMDNTTCSLAVATPLTHPTRYVIGGGGSYNHRDCA